MACLDGEAQGANQPRSSPSAAMGPKPSLQLYASCADTNNRDVVESLVLHMCTLLTAMDPESNEFMNATILIMKFLKTIMHPMPAAAALAADRYHACEPQNAYEPRPALSASRSQHPSPGGESPAMSPSRLM